MVSWAGGERSDTASSTRAQPSLPAIAIALSASASAAGKENAVGLEDELGDAVDASAGEDMTVMKQLCEEFGVCQ